MVSHVSFHPNLMRSQGFLRNLDQGSPTSYRCFASFDKFCHCRSVVFQILGPMSTCTSRAPDALCSVSEALACASSKFCCISSGSARAWFSSSLSFRSCFKVFLSVTSHTFQHNVYLVFSFRTFLATFSPSVFFSFTSVPNSSTWWEMSFHFHREFELFHWSFELCLASSMAERCQLDFEFQSFDDHPACLWVMVRLSTAMFFEIFDTGIRLGEDVDGDMETRIITSQLSGIPCTFIHLRDRRHCHRHKAGSMDHLPCQHPNLFLAICTKPHLPITMNTFVACAIHQWTK